jgi:MiaB-like tRNA modifying enzyme
MDEQSRRVYVKSFGCSANFANGEVIAGSLSRDGFKIVDNPEDAEIVLYNSCAVKSPTENRIISILRKVSKEKQLIVTGCLPLINFKRLEKEVDFNGVTGPAPGSRIVDIIKRVLNGEKVISLTTVAKPNLGLPRIPLNRIVSILPINYGCLGNCSYCCVHLARGHLRSNPIDKIIERVKLDVASGFKEIWLTSQDTASYGKDIGTNLSDLLRKICEIEGKFFVRVGMMNPDQVIGMLGDLVEAFENNKVFKFLHLPVQSGDNTVLKLMNRKYRVKDFGNVIKAFRQEFPKVTVSTDIICGFPGESERAFKHTKQLLVEIQADIVNVSKFFARPRTHATKLEPISPIEINRRSKKISELAKRISLDKNKEWINWKGTVLVDEKGKGETLMGRNFAYKPVVIKANERLIGSFVHVQIVDAVSTYLKAEIVKI